MIVRCVKCKELLAYNSRLSSQVVDRCANDCDAGVHVSPEDTDVIHDCWYKADAETFQKLRAKAQAAAPEIYCENCGALMVTEWSRDEKGDCILAHRCKCENIVEASKKAYKEGRSRPLQDFIDELKAKPKSENNALDCWFKDGNDWLPGFFHQWSQSFEEFENGPGNFPAAIIEDANGRIQVVYAGDVSFSPECPDAPV